MVKSETLAKLLDDLAKLVQDLHYAGYPPEGGPIEQIQKVISHVQNDLKDVLYEEYMKQRKQ